MKPETPWGARVRDRICGCADFMAGSFTECNQPAKYFRRDGDGTGLVCARHALTIGLMFPLGPLCDRPS